MYRATLRRSRGSEPPYRFENLKWLRTLYTPMTGYFLIPSLRHQVIESGYHEPSKSKIIKNLYYFTFSRIRRMCSFPVLVLKSTVKKWTKCTRAQLLYSLLLPTQQNRMNVEEWTAKQARSKQKLSWAERRLRVQKTSVPRNVFWKPTFKMTFHHIFRHFVSDNCEKVAWAVHASLE